MTNVAQDHMLIRGNVRCHAQCSDSLSRLTHPIIGYLAEGEAVLAFGKDIKAMASDEANSRAPTS